MHTASAVFPQQPLLEKYAESAGLQGPGEFPASALSVGLALIPSAATWVSCAERTDSSSLTRDNSILCTAEVNCPSR